MSEQSIPPGYSLMGRVQIGDEVYCQGAAWDADTTVSEVARRAFEAGEERRRFDHSPRFLLVRLRIWWIGRRAARLMKIRRNTLISSYVDKARRKK